MNDTDKYKMQLADKLAPLISKEGLTDITDWVIKNAKEGYNHNGVARSVSYLLEATGRFQREELEDKSRFYVKRLPPKPLKERHPFLHDIILIAIGSILTLIGSYITWRMQGQEPKREIEKINTRIEGLSDTVSNLQRSLHISTDSSKMTQRK